MESDKSLSVFPRGEALPEHFSKYFIGQAYLNMLTQEGVGVGNVTFDPGCLQKSKKSGEKFMEKKGLFSIGRLSKLTGVHIQSLRYYEELGILKPAYTDPESKYRFYTFGHMRIVEAIQYCADLDIPLKHFRDFLLEQDGKIDYSKLISYGKELTYQKIQRIQTRLRFLENMQQEMAHAEACYSQQIISDYIQEKICWAIPYSGTQSGVDFHSALYSLISDVESNGLRAGYNNGKQISH